MTSSPLSQEGVLSGTCYALLAQLCTAAVTTVVTLYVLRALGPEGYGELALVLSVAGFALVLADAAVAQSTGRYTAAGLGDPERIAVVLSSGLRLKLVSTAAAAAALVALAEPIAQAYDQPSLTWPLRVAAVSVVGESLMLLWLVTFASLRRLRLNVGLYLVESLAQAGAILSLLSLGAGVTGAVLGRAAGYAVGAAVGAVLLVRLLGRRLDLRGDRATRRQVSAYARPLFLNAGIYSTYGQVDVQLLAALLGRTAVGLYAAPIRIIVLLGMPGAAVAQAVSPRMTGQQPDAAAFNTALRWLLIYSSLLMAPVVIWAEPITALLLGEDFRGSAVVLAAMAPYLFLNGISMLASTTVNYLGHARRRVPIVLTALVINLVLDLLLLPTIGIVGAAVGAGVSYAVYVPLHLRICRQSFPLPWRPAATTLGRSAAAALAFAAVLEAVGSTSLSPTEWLLGGTGGIAAFLSVLVLTRELTRTDARLLSDVLSRAALRLPGQGARSGARYLRSP